MTDIDIDMLPEWAIDRCNGDYMRLGAVLPTRDGRRTGNATVIDIDMSRELATCITDVGNIMRLNRDELKELFWPPDFIKLHECWPKCKHGVRMPHRNCSICESKL